MLLWIGKAIVLIMNLVGDLEYDDKRCLKVHQPFGIDRAMVSSMAGG